jgi:small subunit ribosomal protein S14
MKREKKNPKYAVRYYIVCLEPGCNRNRAVFRDYQLCRIHLREYIYKGLLPGFKKASW